LLSKFGLSRIKEVKDVRKLSYSLQNPSSDAFASNIKIENGGYSFDVNVKEDKLSSLNLTIGGMHNIENTVAAVTIAKELKIDDEKIKEAVNTFRGVRRRFEYVIAPEKQKEGGYVHPVLIDDYAHHPEELKALLNSVRRLFPQRKMIVVFQPHLYSRTKDLAKGFADALSEGDEVILLPIYPAREKPIAGVKSEMILEKMSIRSGIVLDKEDLLNWMKKHKGTMDKEFGEVIVMAGAGDIDTLVKPVKEIIEKA
jgi:UDP-N-acetylmuramate--alanine ligase